MKSMGVTKIDHYTETQINIAATAKALGHPARIAIVEYLLKVNSCICNDIVNEIPLAQPTISQHLKELKNANIIQGNISGTAICYCLNKETFTYLQEYIQQITTQLTSLENNCC
jgi:DNA-binding transcriptional ArsR family regulator